MDYLDQTAGIPSAPPPIIEGAPSAPPPYDIPGMPSAPPPMPPEYYEAIRELNRQLYNAGVADNPNLIEQLLDQGANIDFQGGIQKETILYMYAQRGDHQVVQYLLFRGANPNLITTDFWTPLHVASYKGELETARVLVSNGAQYSEVYCNWKGQKHDVYSLCPEVVKREMFRIFSSKKESKNQKGCLIQ